MRISLKAAFLIPSTLIFAACGQNSQPPVSASPISSVLAPDPSTSITPAEGWIEIVKGGWQKITYDDQGRVLLTEQFVEGGSVTGAEWMASVNANDIKHAKSLGLNIENLNLFKNYLEGYIASNKAHPITSKGMTALSCYPNATAGLYNGNLVGWASAGCSGGSYGNATAHTNNGTIDNYASPSGAGSSPTVQASTPVPLVYDYYNVCARGTAYEQGFSSTPIKKAYYGGSGRCTN